MLLLFVLFLIILKGLSKEITTTTTTKPVDKEKFTNDSYDRILNLTGFRLLIDAKCNYSFLEDDWQNDTGSMATAVWIVTSYAGDVTKRSALRRAYNNDELQKLGIRRVFLLGTLNENEKVITQRAIEDEAKKFQDIVQGNFVEAYKNLTYKHLMGLQWATEKCSTSYKFIMKMDDDIVINLYEAIELLKLKSINNVHDDFLMGHLMENLSPVRNIASKWFVDANEYSKDVYPNFLSGWFYVIDMQTALKIIYQSKRRYDYFWIDDLFVTGILRKEAGIEYFVDVKSYFTTDYRFLECCLQDYPPKYKCDFIVGPDGAQTNLLMTFKDYSKSCYEIYNCTNRPKELFLNNKCILEIKNNNNLGTGNPQIVSL